MTAMVRSTSCYPFELIPLIIAQLLVLVDNGWIMEIRLS